MNELKMFFVKGKSKFRKKEPNCDKGMKYEKIFKNERQKG